MAVTFAIASPVFVADVTVHEYVTVINGTTTVTRDGPVFMKVVYAILYYYCWKYHIYAIIISCTIFYTIMIFKIREIRKLSKNVSTRSEIRLMYPAFVLFICNLLYLAYFYVWEHFMSTDRTLIKYSEWSIYAIADAYDLNNVYIILITSRQVRMAVLNALNLVKSAFVISSIGQSMPTVGVQRNVVTIQG
uniref:G_PROTEIN_RECEP_F1_2 domain-containing protein n=1 Tax=Panagrellus redivivus TaxID=6233 RepID=A0A7E4ZYW7_PANRE